MIMRINRNPTPHQIRQFGWVILIGFGIIAAAFYLKGRMAMAISLWILSGGVGLWALLLPKTAKIAYLVWMSIAAVMGGITSRLVMGFVFFLIISPIAVVFRLFGRDALQLSRKPTGESYWVAHRRIFPPNYYDRLS